MSDRDARVCVIGLDGGAFCVLDQWVASGDMPNLADLMARGSRCELISTIPPVTGPAWTSLTTGVNPGGHGIYDFFTWNRDGRGVRAVQSGDVAAPLVWDVIGDAGRTVGVFNVPVTHPASPVRGFMVTGMMTPRPGPSMTYPASLHEDLAKHHLRASRCRLRRTPGPGPVRQLTRAAQRMERALIYLLRRYNPDFLICVLQELDQLQHHFWRYCDKAVGGPDPGIRASVAEFFRRLDRTIGVLVRFYGERTRFFVVSDHGFGPLAKACLLNRYLARKGFLRVDWQRVSRGPSRRRLMAAGGHVLNALGLLGPARAVLARARRAVGRAHHFGSLLPAGVVDWSRTRACVKSYTDHGVHINLRGRDPHGIVEPGAEYERTLGDLIGALEALKDPVSGGRLVTQVIRREEIYSGPHAREGPDLHVVLRDGAVKSVPALDGRFLMPTSMAAWHRPEGILVACGPAIRAASAPAAHIVDVAPTVLYAMGLAVPRYIDGNVLTGLFEERFRDEHPVRRSEDAPGVRAKRPEQIRSTPEDEAAVRDRLRRLGYL